MEKRGEFSIGHALVLLGIFLVLIGISSLAVPLATVKVGPVEIGGLTPFSAACIGVGIIFILIGLGAMKSLAKSRIEGRR